MSLIRKSLSELSEDDLSERSKPLLGELGDFITWRLPGNADDHAAESAEERHTKSGIPRPP